VVSEVRDASSATDDMPRLKHAASKVPEVTMYFWVIKVLTTGMGEAASDFLVKNVGPVAVGLAGLAFAVSLIVQFRAKRYSTWIYWSAIVMVSVFGTMAADIPHFLGVPVAATSAFYLIALVAIFWAWYAKEGTLSFEAIDSRGREAFYWASVMATFALGTAIGDLTARLWGGFLVAGLVFAGLIVLPAAAHRWAGLNSVAAFWIAYILTRPLGASFADWMAVPAKHRGLGLGTGVVTGCWSLAILAVLTYVALGRKGTRADPATVSS
jgi:uncharacterized membrane-anchored protein